MYSAASSPSTTAAAVPEDRTRAARQTIRRRWQSPCPLPRPPWRRLPARRRRRRRRRRPPGARLQLLLVEGVLPGSLLLLGGALVRPGELLVLGELHRDLVLLDELADVRAVERAVRQELGRHLEDDRFVVVDVLLGSDVRANHHVVHADVHLRAGILKCSMSSSATSATARRPGAGRARTRSRSRTRYPPR